jgi:putative DNA primase/helicase
MTDKKKPTTAPDYEISLEDIHDPEIRAYLVAENVEPVEEDNDNVVDISALVAPGAGIREVAQALATLELHEYDQVARAQAKAHGCKVSTLNKYVEEERAKHAAKATAPTQRERWAVDPVSHPVDGAALFNSIEALITSHVILPRGSATAIALWIGHTWTMDAARHTPLLCLFSPEPECGKTTAIKAIMRLCHRPLIASNISPAAVFRVIDQEKPTIAIDEGDSQAENMEALRNVLNSGHDREGAFIWRVEEINGKREAVEFSTFAPKLLARIGKAAPTIMSRGIIVWLRRKSPDEAVAHIDESEAEFSALPSCLARWADDTVEQIKRTKPKLPPSLSNRAADNWRELFRIAEVLGGGWPAKLTAAAAALTGNPASDSESTRAMLLADIKALFEEKNTDRLASTVIVDHLAGLEHRPWPEWKGGRPMTARQLAKQLEPFQIVPTQFKLSGVKERGYHLHQFLDAFGRYLPPESGTAVPTAPNQAFDHLFDPVPQVSGTVSENARKSHETKRSTAVPIQAPPRPGIREHVDDIGAIPAFLDRRMPRAVVADDAGDGWEAQP